MENQELLKYIRLKMDSGSSKDDVKASLMKAGWQESDVDEGLKFLDQSSLPPSSPAPQPEKVMQENPTPFGVVQSSKSPKKVIFLTIVIIFALLLAGGGFYWHANKSGLFAISPYTESNLLSGLLSAASKINSSSYAVSASLTMAQRDADATPFVSKLANAGEVEKQYERDYKRVQDVGTILRLLTLNFKNKGAYAANIHSLLAGNNYTSATDPVSQQPYNYTLTENGKNFSLVVAFETLSAISGIKEAYSFSNTAVIINGKTVTFTKDSDSYLYISPVLPKPLIVSFSDSLGFVPPETNISFSASAQTDFTNKDSANWKFNGDATGDFGDLTYKMNIDAVRKDEMYYVRVNNMPSLFFSFIEFEKGQWVKIDPSNESSLSRYSYFSDLPDLEKKYKENRQKMVDALKKMIEAADSEKLFTFKNAPHKETVSGRVLYRYDLSIRKEAIAPFYKRLLEIYEATNISDTYSPLAAFDGYLEYLQSPEFSEIFDYYQKNTSLALWVDQQGFPASISYSMRIVPGNSLEQLKDKQANLVFKLDLSDINQPVKIDAPADAKNLEDVFGGSINNEKDAQIKGNLSTILINAAVHYDANGSYPNFCSSTPYTQPAAAITTAGGNPICKVNSVQNAWCACSSLKAVTGDAYCVDSTGYMRQTTNTCVNACVNGVCR